MLLPLFFIINLRRNFASNCSSKSCRNNSNNRQTNLGASIMTILLNSNSHNNNNNHNSIHSKSIDSIVFLHPRSFRRDNSNNNSIYHNSSLRRHIERNNSYHSNNNNKTIIFLNHNSINTYRRNLIIPTATVSTISTFTNLITNININIVGPIHPHIDIRPSALNFRVIVILVKSVTSAMPLAPIDAAAAAAEEAAAVVAAIAAVKMQQMQLLLQQQQRRR